MAIDFSKGNQEKCRDILLEATKLPIRISEAKILDCDIDRRYKSNSDYENGRHF